MKTYNVHIHCGGNEFNWYKTTPDNTYQIPGNDLDDIYNTFLDYWSFDIMDDCKIGDTLHIWSPLD